MNIPGEEKNGKGWVVGVGASAGGLEALTQFVSQLSASFRGTIIIAQHLAPHAKSMMVELLARQTVLPVKEAIHHQSLVEGEIYIVPPNFDIDILDEHIILTEAGPETRPKPSVDNFFNSLARVYGERAVGIVLSGTGTDGSEGVRAIRNAGGITLAQDGDSAKYDGMPRSAVDTGSVDSILSAGDMGRNLTNILHEHGINLQSSVFQEDELETVLGIVKKSQGTDFSLYKPSTIRRRLAKRITQVGLHTIHNYIQFLKDTPGEMATLEQELLVSVTSFFRDSEIFEAMRGYLRPALENKGVGTEFRAWVAGCATGEEAYSLAMLIADISMELRKSISVKIFATDLDQDAILEARNGVYDESSVEKVPADFQKKYLQERGGGKYEIIKPIRDMVVFARQDLVQNAPFVKLDLVSCRNVLIYFEPELQKRVLETFHYALSTSGILLLGKSESLGNVSSLFEPLDRSLKIFSRLKAISNFAPGARRSTSVSSLPLLSQRRPLERGPSLAEKGLAKLMRVYGYAGLLIDEESNVVQILGDVSEFIGFYSSQSDFRLINLLPKAAGMEILILIRKALKEDNIQKSRWYAKSKGVGNYQIAISPMNEPEDKSKMRPLLLVSFEQRKERRKTVEASAVVADSELPARVRELEQELYATREHLQATVEELGVANEELQSLNEELSSTNEELQSSNEELETTNEELQSSNEELTTVNEELGVKSTEIRLANTSLENIQNSIGSPMVVLDSKLRIIRYNKEALKIFSLHPADLGREITRISAKCELPDFEHVVRASIEKEKISEILCEGDGVVYQMRSLPYFDENGKITGAVVFFFDNTTVIRTSEQLSMSEQRTREIIDSSTNIIYIKDHMGRYMMVNNSFQDFFKLKEAAVLGKTDREVLNEKMATHFRDLDLAVFIKREVIRQNEAFYNFNGQKSTFLVSRFPLIDKETGNTYATGMIAVDVTVQIQAQQALKESEARYRAIIEDQAVFVCRHKLNGELVFTNSVFMAHFKDIYDSHLQHSFFDFVAPEDRAKVKNEIQQISPERPVAQYEHRVLRKDGSIRWVRWIHRGIFNASGEASEFQAVGFDVTEYRTQTDQLIEKESLFSGIFSNISDFITIFRIVKNEFILESLNRTAEKTLGLGYNQLVGQSLKEILPGNQWEALAQRCRLVIESGRPEVFDESFGILGNEKYFSTTVVPIPSSQGRIERVAVVSRDVSGYKTIEKDLRAAKDTAEVANRAKSDFLASMSHELRTPLNVVLGMSHLLEETRLDQDQLSFVGSIARSGSVLLSLIEDILDISKIESGKIKLESVIFRVSDLVSELVELFSIQVSEKGLQIQSHIEKEADHYVVGDPARLRQVLMNLIGNAIKFTDKGVVRVQVSSKGLEQAGEKEFTFSVSDTGIGIRQEDHEKIFKKFSQVESGHSRRFGGSGLGLVISRHLIHLMKGGIDFESEYGKGSTFHFSVKFPLSNRLEAEHRRRHHFLTSAKPTLGPNVAMRILAVEDNRESQNVIRLFLRKLGHEVSIASNGYEALEQIRQQDFDIVMMDVQMPEMDGYETVRRLREMGGNYAEIPVVALTANAMSGDSDKCLEAGMNDYLTKPIRMDALKEVLSRWTPSTEH